MVYIVYSPSSNLVKIGHTANFTKRLKSLKKEYTEALVVIKTFEGDKSIESAMHREFSRFRVAGEWFNYSTDMIEFDPSKVRTKDKKDIISVPISFPIEVYSSLRREAKLQRRSVQAQACYMISKILKGEA